MAESGERAVGWAVPELGSADGRPLEASPLDTYDGVLLVYRTAEPVAEFYSTAVFYLQNCIFENGADGTRTHALRRAKSRGSFAKHKTGPKSRFARRRSKTIGLQLADDCSNVVVLRWRSTYCQTPS